MQPQRRRAEHPLRKSFKEISQYVRQAFALHHSPHKFPQQIAIKFVHLRVIRIASRITPKPANFINSSNNSDVLLAEFY